MEGKDHRLIVLLVLILLICLLNLSGPDRPLSHLLFSPSQTESQIFWLSSSAHTGALYYGRKPVASQPGPATSHLSPKAAPFFFLPIPINRADKETLTTLSGIGPVLAERIITMRSQKGGRLGPEDLLNMRGIGPKSFKRLLPLISFQ